jgi:hypothetical protein
MKPYSDIFYNLLDQLSLANEKQKEMKEQILKDWVESKKLPRKRKKEVRKKLQVKWDIYNIDLFNLIKRD